MQQKSSYVWQIFRRRKVFLPVIHPVSEQAALQSIETSILAGADGVFLINQGMSTEELLEFIPVIRTQFPDLWMGVNLLGTDPAEVVDKVAHLPIGGIWSDNSYIDEQSDHQPAAERFRQARRRQGWLGLYFGGVAFKYQRHIPEPFLAAAAQKATTCVDVITSSGEGTGIPASLEKVRALRSGAGHHPMALASGISPENVADYLPLVDIFLVASEIETEPYSGILVPERTKLLADLIHGWRGTDGG